MSNLFSSGSFLWPALVAVFGVGLVVLIALIVMGVVVFRKKEETTVVEQHLAAKRLNTVLAETDLHVHDKAVLDSVAGKLEPGPITREGQEAQLKAMLEAASKKPEKPA